MEIHYQFWEDDAALFGPDPEALEGVDVKASYGSYQDAVADALAKAYPKAHILVDTGAGFGNGKQVYYDPDEEISPRDHDAEVSHIENIIHKVWESWGWVVYNK